jgi:hypothetical protein
MTTKTPGRLLWAVLAILCFPTRTQAGPVALTKDDVVLSLHASSDGTSFTALESTGLLGLFGPHRCQCPNTLAVQLATTASGTANIGTSTIGVTFLLGANCPASPGSCTNLGQISFSKTQTAAAPTFSSSLVFQAATGTAAVTCSSLVARSTTIWAALTQDGAALPFTPTIEVPITTGTVSAPTAVTATPSDKGILVAWTPPKDQSLLAGYQVLCLPGPTTAEPAGYESCGLGSSSGNTTLSPANASQVCSQPISASETSVRLSGLTNGRSYTLAVVAIDPSGAVSALSPTATAVPQETLGFWEDYKQDGGAAMACSMTSPRSRPANSVVVLAAALLLGLLRRSLRGRRLLGTVVFFVALGTAPAIAQDEAFSKHNDDWAREDRPAPRLLSPPTWGFQVGLSWYRPAIDQEDPNGYHPFADTFSGARHPMWVAELDRYLGHHFGSWGASFRAGFYRVTAKAFLADGSGGRSGDETSLRLIPLSASAFYRATDLPGLRHLPLIPYAKLGLDAVDWTVTKTGSSDSQSNISIGWHAAAGAMLGFAWLGVGTDSTDGVADPFGLFFEWDYSKIDGMGLTHSLQVGDSIWFAGVAFDL